MVIKILKRTRIVRFYWDDTFLHKAEILARVQFAFYNLLYIFYMFKDGKAGCVDLIIQGEGYNLKFFDRVLHNNIFLSLRRKSHRAHGCSLSAMAGHSPAPDTIGNFFMRLYEWQEIGQTNSTKQSALISFEKVKITSCLRMLSIAVYKCPPFSPRSNQHLN